MPTPKSGRPCIYCGGKVGRVKRGEHVIPEAIGGALTIKTVCGACNNGFSQIDAELCSRSPLSVVASQEIDAHLWQVWDVDHAAHNLLLEARPDWTAHSLTQFPQIVFDRSDARPQIRGDFEEMLRFGGDSFERVLVRSTLRAFRRHEAGVKRWLHFERVDRNPRLERSYRLPPRIFARYSIRELAERLLANRRASMVLRYQTEADRRFALNALDTWRPTGGFSRLEIGIGSALPPMRCLYDPQKVLRAIAKIAVNLLAFCCSNSPVDRHGLGEVVRVIRGETAPSAAIFDLNGFVDAIDIDAIKADNGAHSFRLLHMGGWWHVYSAFFGGRIGTFVRFPGSNREDWACADVTAPLRSKQWTIRTGRILQPLNVHVEWDDPAKIMPTVEMLNVQTEHMLKVAASG